MRVYVTGDTHGHYDIKKLTSKKFPEGQDLTKEDYVIVLGDFGLVFNNHRTREEQYWLEWLNDKPWTTLFFRGNHDNEPKLQAELKNIPMFGGTVGQIDNFSIYRLFDGYCYTIDDKKFLIIGGAFSIDKDRRIAGRDWWSTEELSFMETKTLYKTIEAHSWKFDFVLTHDAPSWVRDVLHNRHLEQSYTVRLLDDIFGKNKFDFKHHYFGHHHIDRTVYDKHTCCYQIIKQVL